MLNTLQQTLSVLTTFYSLFYESLLYFPCESGKVLKFLSIKNMHVKRKLFGQKIENFATNPCISRLWKLKNRPTAHSPPPSYPSPNIPLKLSGTTKETQIKNRNSRESFEYQKTYSTFNRTCNSKMKLKNKKSQSCRRFTYQD